MGIGYLLDFSKSYNLAELNDAGSILIPGPIVELSVMLRRYCPLAVEGFKRNKVSINTEKLSAS